MCRQIEDVELVAADLLRRMDAAEARIRGLEAERRPSAADPPSAYWQRAFAVQRADFERLLREERERAGAMEEAASAAEVALGHERSVSGELRRDLEGSRAELGRLRSAELWLRLRVMNLEGELAKAGTGATPAPDAPVSGGCDYPLQGLWP